MARHGTPSKGTGTNFRSEVPPCATVPNTSATKDNCYVAEAVAKLLSVLFYSIVRFLQSVKYSSVICRTKSLLTYANVNSLGEDSEPCPRGSTQRPSPCGSELCDFSVLSFTFSWLSSADWLP